MSDDTTPHVTVDDDANDAVAAEAASPSRSKRGKRRAKLDARIARSGEQTTGGVSEVEPVSDRDNGSHAVDVDADDTARDAGDDAAAGDALDIGDHAAPDARDEGDGAAADDAGDDVAADDGRAAAAADEAHVGDAAEARADDAAESDATEARADDDGRVVGEASMPASAFEAITGELQDPELFDPEEVANAPRAPHPLKPVVEALIFASPEPLTLKAMARLLDDQPREDIEAALSEVRESYLRSDGLQLVEVAGGFQIVTRPELYEWVRRLFKERTTSKLSVQALETLAVIAYKQPVTSGEIAEIRGVSATTGVLNTLLDRKLVKIVGRKQVVGRPFMYGTTREFLDKFGLRDLSDLPKVEDMSEALGFDLPSPVDEGDGVSLPFDDAAPAEPLLFEADELPASTAAAVSGDLDESRASSDGHVDRVEADTASSESGPYHRPGEAGLDAEAPAAPDAQDEDH